MVAGRIVAGLGNGINTSTIPVWHSELMKAEERGKGLSIELAINIFGVATAYWVDYGMSFVENESQFRFPLALQVLFALVTAMGLFACPESPRWLIAHDRFEEARDILSRLRLSSENHNTVNHEMADIKHAVDEERAAAAGNGFRA
ncbi:hypothetical protein BST61_g3960 [Cercospora zeina]